GAAAPAADDASGTEREERAAAPSPQPPPKPETKAPPGESKTGNGASGHETVTGTRGIRPARPQEDAERDEVVPMSPLRRTAAARLVEAQRRAALVTTFNEIDLSAVQAARARYRPPAQERHGVALGLMPFFVKALVDALGRFPALNAEVRGADIVYHRRFDIGVAVGGGKGLVVPVLRDADRLSFAEIEKAVEGFAERARSNRIGPDELSGGTFTITNGGVYGSLLSTPIVNPPQSCILGMHAIQDRPVAANGQVAIRPMMYAALTYDHRVVDGREGVGFLGRIKETVEDPLRLLLEL
ncbi:MAG: 2-oxo acid dehydrogenase subunit E2, partial [Elusimicrobia bacterium]|nr:2-oxo acid dehydrogenase subunit E2 [Elusimicrobiota bacterium]